MNKSHFRNFHSWNETEREHRNIKNPLLRINIICTNNKQTNASKSYIFDLIVNLGAHSSEANKNYWVIVWFLWALLICEIVSNFKRNHIWVLPFLILRLIVTVERLTSLAIKNNTFLLKIQEKHLSCFMKQCSDEEDSALR